MPDLTGYDPTTGPHAPLQNADRELWRERPDDYYASSLFVTESGGIGINVGGTVFVKPIAHWHMLARLDAARADAPVVNP